MGLQVQGSGSFTFSSPSVSGSLTLFLRGYASASGGMTLFCKGAGHSTGTCDLYIAASLPASGGCALFERGIGFSESDVPLYEHGYLSASGDPTPLFIGAVGFTTGEAPLFIHAIDSYTKSLPLSLKVEEPPTTTGGAWLFAQGSTDSGVFKATSLFVDATNEVSGHIPLFLNVFDIDARQANFPLSIEGANGRVALSADLVLWNEANASIDVPLFIQGDGVTDGYTPYGHGMNLMICRRESYASQIPLFLLGPGTPGTGNCDLFALGHVPLESGTCLAIPNTIDDATGICNLYIHGFNFGY